MLYVIMYVSEDWVEMFVYYLYICDVLDIVVWCGLVLVLVIFDWLVLGFSVFNIIIDKWLLLLWLLNMVNCLMGYDDLYFFVLLVVVLEKMWFIYIVVDEVVLDFELVYSCCIV